MPPQKSPLRGLGKKRIRKDYRDLTQKERGLYWKAVQKAKDTPAGPHFTDANPGNNLYDTFVIIHAWRTNKAQAHSTSAFLPWHRKFLVEFESMLRSLGDEFACLTIPYWDWSQNAEMCAQDPSCVTWHHNDPVLQDSEDQGREVRRTEENIRVCIWRAPARVVLDACQTRLRSRTGSIIMANAYRVDMTGFGTNKHDRKGPLVSYRQLWTPSQSAAYGTSEVFGSARRIPPQHQHNMLGGHARSLESPADHFSCIIAW